MPDTRDSETDAMTKPLPNSAELTRRNFFERAADGVHGAALAWLLSRELFGKETLRAEDPHDASTTARRIHDLRQQPTHFAPRAKSVIQLFMNGGPSQVDLFDPKPALNEHDGEPYFDKIASDVSSPEAAGGLLRSPFKFAQHGESGI